MAYGFDFVNTKYNIETLTDICENHFLPMSDWRLICENQILTEEFIDKFYDYLDDGDCWFHISSCQNISEEFILKHEKKIRFVYVGKKQILSEEFILKNISRFSIESIIKNQTLSLNCINAYIERYPSHTSTFKCMFLYQKLDEELIADWGNKRFI